VKKPDILFLFLKNIDTYVSIFKYIDAMLLNLDPDISVPDRVYTPPVVNNMAEAPVPQQTKRKFVNLSVFKNFIKFQNF
jgi:hypothetical protein